MRERTILSQKRHLDVREWKILLNKMLTIAICVKCDME